MPTGNLANCVGAEGAVTFLDPARAGRGREVRLAEAAAIENLLEWPGR